MDHNAKITSSYRGTTLDITRALHSILHEKLRYKNGHYERKESNNWIRISKLDMNIIVTSPNVLNEFLTLSSGYHIEAIHSPTNLSAESKARYLEIGEGLSKVVTKLKDWSSRQSIINECKAVFLAD
jgi:hypothetical protein